MFVLHWKELTLENPYRGFIQKNSLWEGKCGRSSLPPTPIAPRQARVLPKRTHCGLENYESHIFIQSKIFFCPVPWAAASTKRINCGRKNVEGGSSWIGAAPPYTLLTGYDFIQKNSLWVEKTRVVNFHLIKNSRLCQKNSLWVVEGFTQKNSLWVEKLGVVNFHPVKNYLQVLNFDTPRTIPWKGWKFYDGWKFTWLN